MPIVSTICRLAVALLVLASFPSLARAQNIYLDADGDGTHTSADVVRPDGATTIDLYLRTDRNRDGSAASCPTGDGALDLRGYEVALRALRDVDGRVRVALLCRGSLTGGTGFEAPLELWAVQRHGAQGPPVASPNPRNPGSGTYNVHVESADGVTGGKITVVK